MTKIFRFDDICVNANMELAHVMASHLLQHGDVWFCVSPLVHERCGQRVYPKDLNPVSDHRLFFEADRCGVPPVPDGVVVASHGLVHCDHKYLTYEQQELSILASCSLVGTAIFVPPHNKWNEDTEEICAEHGINLVKWEEGWLSMEHNKYDLHHERWYLHSRRWTLDLLQQWLADSTLDAGKGNGNPLGPHSPRRTRFDSGARDQ
jgi:hypothetical protein